MVKAGGEIEIDAGDGLIFPVSIPGATNGGLRWRRNSLKSGEKAGQLALYPPTDSAGEAVFLGGT